MFVLHEVLAVPAGLLPTTTYRTMEWNVKIGSDCIWTSGIPWTAGIPWTGKVSKVFVGDYTTLGIWHGWGGGVGTVGTSR